MPSISMPFSSADNTLPVNLSVFRITALTCSSVSSTSASCSRICSGAKKGSKPSVSAARKKVSFSPSLKIVIRSASASVIHTFLSFCTTGICCGEVSGISGASPPSRPQLCNKFRKNKKRRNATPNMHRYFFNCILCLFGSL